MSNLTFSLLSSLLCSWSLPVPLLAELSANLITTLTIIGSALTIIIGGAVTVALFYRKVDQGSALIINRLRAVPEVKFTGGIVVPIIHRAEIMDISVKTIIIDRRGTDGLICFDNIRADIKVTFFVRVNPQESDVMEVARAIGAKRASDQQTLEALFTSKFSDGLKTVGRQLNFQDLYTKRDEFKAGILQTIGELNGYRLDDCAIDYLEQTPMTELDPANVLDSQGIHKITQITAEQNIKTNHLKQEERKAITKQNVESDEAVFELERQRSDAKAKQEREIATIQARESAETQKVEAEEKKKADVARIKQEEETSIQHENRLREVEVAQKNRERVVAVETERVEKDRALEAISREREVELQRIAKEKALEIEKKDIADVVAARVAVDKNVAQEEELIKDLRVLAEAKRSKDARVIAAEAEAQENLVKHIKSAEAQEQVAKHKAKETLTLAEADLEASDKQARAKIRLSEGVQAEQAAPGLAQVKVKEANAMAIEKQGQAEARVQLQKMQAEAQGQQEQGLATVKVKEADAAAVQKQGEAEAEARRVMLVATAQGREAEASAIEKVGIAEAVAIRQKMEAEAHGLGQKAEAMKALDASSREHEEFRIRLEKDKEIELGMLKTREKVAEHQASVMSHAMASAKINIVGGDGEFFDRFVNAVTLGQSLDATVDNSETAKTVLAEYLDGRKSLPADVVEVLSRPALDSEAIKNLGVTALIRQLMSNGGEADRAKYADLLAEAQRLGVK
jgi:uncharacterized membrane protein YqiK